MLSFDMLFLVLLSLFLKLSNDLLLIVILLCDLSGSKLLVVLFTLLS